MRAADRTAPRQASEREAAWWQSLEELRSRFERELTHQLTRLGLSPSAYGALEQLATHPSGLKVTELARHIRLSPSSTSRVVERLVRDGLVERRPGPHDRRTVHGRITDPGRALYETARPAHRRALAHALDAGPTGLVALAD